MAVPQGTVKFISPPEVGFSGSAKLLRQHWEPVAGATRYFVEHGTLNVNAYSETTTNTYLQFLPYGGQEYIERRIRVTPENDEGRGTPSVIHVYMAGDWTKPTVSSSALLGTPTHLSFSTRSQGADTPPASGNMSGMAGYRYYISYDAGETFTFLTYVAKPSGVSDYVYSNGKDGAKIKPNTTFIAGVTAIDVQGNESEIKTVSVTTAPSIKETLAGSLKARTGIKAAVLNVKVGERLAGSIKAVSRLSGELLTTVPLPQGKPEFLPPVYSGQITSNTQIMSILWEGVTGKIDGWKIWFYSYDGAVTEYTRAASPQKFDISYSRHYSTLQLRVQAFNKAGYGEMSEIYTFRTGDHTLPVISSVTESYITAVSFRVNVSATDPKPTTQSNASGVAGYLYEISEDGENWSLVRDIKTTSGSSNFTYTSAEAGIKFLPNTTYTVGVRAYDNFGLISVRTVRQVTTAVSPIETLAGEIKAVSRFRCFRMHILKLLNAKLDAQTAINPAKLLVTRQTYFNGFIVADTSIEEARMRLKRRLRTTIKGKTRLSPMPIKVAVFVEGYVTAKAQIKKAPLYIRIRLAGRIRSRSRCFLGAIDVTKGRHIIARCIGIQTALERSYNVRTSYDKVINIGGDNRDC